MPDNRPRAREKRVTGPGAGVHRRGSGTGSGPVGSGSAFGGAPSGGGGGGKRAMGGGLGLLGLILVALLGRGGLFGGGGSASPAPVQQTQAVQTQAAPTSGSQSGYGALSDLLGGSGSSGSGQSSSGSSSGSGSYGGYGSLAELFGSAGGSSSGWGSSSYGTGSVGGSSNTGVLNREVAPEAREKFTKLKGNGRDTVTILVYICGTDLESRNAMATRDIQEMTKANISDKVNLILYTGGCKRWQNNVMSSSKNQVFQVVNGSLRKLAETSAQPMTDPATLQSFLEFGRDNFPADRNILIFWDHGGGSVSGYGYDEKNGGGSMSLGKINSALKNVGQKYDFIGFDTCLLATVENALMLSSYSDYMIASEETEPGIGWYYTDWLSMLSKNTSVPTLDLGKKIIDDFVSACASQCRGQQTTLSMVDLAELGSTLGPDFKSFSQDTQELIQNDSYKQVSSARNSTREFAKSTGIDQIDLVHFAKNMGTEAGDRLAATLLSAVKYNRTSSNMTNAYGLSAYFPYRAMGKVRQALSALDGAGVDDSYADCIREFASLQTMGQAASGGASSPAGSLFGELLGGGSYGGSQGGSYGGSQGGYSSSQSADELAQLLELFLGGSGGISVSGLSGANSGFLAGRSMPTEDAAAYIAANHFDASLLQWEKDDEGRSVIRLPEEQWSMVSDLNLNLFYDDGEGYVDLGLDNVFSFGDDGSLIADVDGTWLSINNQPVAYYHTDTTEDGDQYTISGYVPALLNGERVDLILRFDNENPYGVISGARPVYDELTETDTVARGLTELKAGDTLEFLCDFYSYDGTFQDSYLLGEPMTIGDTVEISNTELGDGGVKALYRFTDMYGQHYWTPEV